MRYGETGYHLEIDLATGNIEKVETDPKMTELHLGGLGTSVKIHWDRVPPETKPFDPENLLIFSTGVLNGTPAFSANRTVVTFVSPQSELLAYPMMGGFWSAELKYAGYDKVIFRNKSPEWVYLWIKDDKVEIRDASHLKGKGALETQDLIRDELNEPHAQVAAIGLAGENRVFVASIEQSRSSASRLGGGAVMGDKKIKAVAVRGTGDVHLARGAEFMEHMKEVTEYINFRNSNPIPDVMTILSGIGSPQEMVHTDEKWHTESFAWGNARSRRKGFWTEEIEKSWADTQTSAIKRLISCYNCPQHCGALINYPNVPRYMMKCFSKLTYGMAAYVDNLDFGFKIVQQASEYGVDGFSTPQILAFAVELQEAGILTDKDLEGCPSDNEGRFFWLLDRLVRREGIGDALADGTYWAALKIGNGAEEYAHNNIKKHEQV
ncbi:aldehyde ferredoxin oxidoreductase N-terminal domain-containing protein, partial [Acidobacteriota bacterium]